LIPKQVFVHPWDLYEEGPGQVFRVLSDLNFRKLVIPAFYHEVRLVLRHNPIRKEYVSEDGVAYFEPNWKLFEKTEIKPIRSSDFGRLDALAVASENAKEYGLKLAVQIDVGVLTGTNVMQAQTLVMKNAMACDQFEGRRFLCPSNSEVQRYLQAVTENLVDVYDPESVEFAFASYPINRTAVAIYPLMMALSPCFCNACQRRAKTEGLDLSTCANEVRELEQGGEGFSAEMIKNPLRFRLGTVDILRTFVSFPWLADWIEFREEVFTSIISNLRDVCSEKGVRVVTQLRSTPSEAWLYGQNLEAMSKVSETFKTRLLSIDNVVQMKERYRSLGLDQNSLQELMRVESEMDGVYRPSSFEQLQSEWQMVEDLPREVKELAEATGRSVIAQIDVSRISTSSLRSWAKKLEEVPVEFLEFYSYGQSPLESLAI
jgi:hypothetical protein